MADYVMIRDSDVAKWLEAACYVLAKYPDSSLHHLAEEAVDNIRGAQQEDGYINTYYTVSSTRTLHCLQS